MRIRIEHHEDVRWRDKQQRDRLAVAERLRQGREEVLEAGCARDAHVCDSEEVSLGVLESQLHASNLRHAACFVDVCFCGIDRETAVGNVLLFGCERAPGIGEIGQYEYDEDADSNGYRSFDDIEPLPGAHALLAS